MRKRPASRLRMITLTLKTGSTIAGFVVNRNRRGGISSEDRLSDLECAVAEEKQKRKSKNIKTISGDL